MTEPVQPIEIEFEVACSPEHAFDTYLWHLGTDRGRATEVDISFTGDAAATTVAIIHRGWERLGADALAWRQHNLGGWSGLLPHFRQAATAPAGAGSPRWGRLAQPRAGRIGLSTAP